MGWCGKGEFWSKCRRVKKGDTEGMFTEHVDAGKMQYKELRDLDSLLVFS
jgi:hypothetical protein